MSDNSSQMVQERPAWLLPLIVAAGVAVFSAAFAYYYFGPTPSELLGLAPRASESSEKVNMIIGDSRFLVPSNFTRYPLQRVGGTQNEIDLHALLPELAPYSIERREAFEDNTSGAMVVHIKIHLAENLLPATRRFDEIYSRHLADRIPAPGPTGLQRFYFSENSGYRDQDLFVEERGQIQPLLLLCFRESVIIFSPNCTRTFRISDTVALTYRYKRTQLKSWATVDRAVTALVESFIVAKATDDISIDGEGSDVTVNPATPDPQLNEDITPQ